MSFSEFVQGWDEMMREIRKAKAVSDISTCDKCGAQYPSAPQGYIHKCGKCSGGRMVREQPAIVCIDPDQFNRT